MLALAAASTSFTFIDGRHTAAVRQSFRRSAAISLKAFSELREFDQKLAALEAVGINGLNGFYDAEKRGFALTPSAPRFSVTTTIFSLLAIDANPKAWTTAGQAAQQQRVRGCLDALLDANWREDDVAQLVFVLTALRILDPQATLLHGEAAAHHTARLSAAVSAMIDARPQRRAGRNQPLSAYLRFWMALASTQLLNPSGELDPFFSPALPDDAFPPKAADGVELTLTRGCARARLHTTHVP